jgi:hypothetical protein
MKSILLEWIALVSTIFRAVVNALFKATGERHYDQRFFSDKKVMGYVQVDPIKKYCKLKLTELKNVS